MMLSRITVYHPKAQVIDVKRPEVGESTEASIM